MSITRTDLNNKSRDEFVGSLANIFEHSPWIAEHVALLRPFAGINASFRGNGSRG